MDFIFNTDNQLPGSADNAGSVERLVRERLNPRFAHRLSRVEVHLRDLDGERNGGDSIEATIEARPRGSAPVSASDRSRNSGAALRGALNKIVARLDSDFGKADRVRA